MKFAKVCGIYKIENKINGKKYIGQSIDIHRRWVDHRRDIKARNYFLYQAFKKYGISNFSFEIIEECTEEELNEKEAYWIKFYVVMNFLLLILGFIYVYL
jgi:group I intron endonuclease